MKLVLVGIALMSIVPASLAPVVLSLAALLALIEALGKREFPTFETVTQNRRMAAAVDPRLLFWLGNRR